MKNYTVSLPKKVITRILAQEFTRFLIMVDNEVSSSPMMLIHTSDINNSTLNIRMDHYHIEEKEKFIDFFSDNKSKDIRVIPMDIINKIDNGDCTDSEINTYIGILNDLYRFMESTSSTSANFTPPIRIVDVADESNKEES